MGRGPVGEPAIIKYVNNSLASVDDVSNTDGSMILIKTLTASSDSALNFVNGTSDVVLDSTYPIYKFVYTSIHSEEDDRQFQVGFRDGGSNYDATKTTTYFYSYHDEGGTSTGLTYYTTGDLAQSTSAQPLSYSSGNGNDESLSGELTIYNPSSTTFVKHFIANNNVYHKSNFSQERFVAGYGNNTSAVDAIKFEMDSGAFDGKIKLYGIKDS